MSSEKKPKSELEEKEKVGGKESVERGPVLEKVTATVNVLEGEKALARRGKETPGDEVRSGGGEDETFRGGGSRSPSSSGVKINLNLNINFNLKSNKVRGLVLILDLRVEFEFGGRLGLG